MSRRLTTQEFVDRARMVHGYKYDYSKVEYVNYLTKVVVTCFNHGDWLITPENHIQGKGCPECGRTKSGISKKKFHNRKRDWNFDQPKDYKLIPLTRGKFAKVDNEDFDKVKDINWNFSGGYAYNKLIGHMHRYIMNAPDDMLVDHREIEETLDNRKSNLRLATRPQNSANTKPRKGSSKYKGVGWRKPPNKWHGFIGYKGKTYHLGYFEDEIECAKVRDKKALELHGEFAYLNFPELKEEYLKEFEQYIK